MIHIKSFVLLLFVTACASAGTRYNFNSDWKLHVGDPAVASAGDFDDSSWKQISTPHAWNEDEAFARDIHALSTGVAWYRKHFKLPAGAENGKVFLEFEGIRHGGEFYLNGQSIGRHENGVMAFGFDITKLIKPAPAENVLAARIDSAWNYHEQASGSTFQWADRNFYANYGGINKNVFLVCTGLLHQTLPLYSNLGTTGVYFYARDFDIAGHSAAICVESQVKNDSSEAKTFDFEAVVEEIGGKQIATIKGARTTLAPGETTIVRASQKVSDLKFWSWGYGYLYNVRTILKVNGKPVDQVTTRTGFRKTEFAHGVLTLNDRVIQLKGYAQRTTNEWPAVGLSVPAWMSDFSNGLAVESNANLVRWMHVTPWKQDVESCDRVGLMQAMPAGDSERDVTGRRWEQRVEVMRDAIIYNRNNPSVIFYECGNKGISEEHMSEMKAIRDQFDPHGGRAIGAREMLDSAVAEYGGEMLYINKSAAKPMWATEYSRDEGLRKYWDEFTPPFHANGPDYNRNQDSHAIEDVVRWFDYWRQRPGTGKRVSGGGVNIIFADSNTHFRGADVKYRASGEVDPMRIPKDGFFAHQVMWDGWVDVERPRVHIIGHWNYAPGTTKDVYVVSSAEKCELLINGASQGFGEQSSRFLFTFKNIEWKPGTIKAIGYSANGKKLCETQHETAGPPAEIRLTARSGLRGFFADGADMALIDVEVVDERGNRCPTAMNAITFALDGAGEWRGGTAVGPDNYILAKTLPVECGVNRVIIRSTRDPGEITLRAIAEGLKDATVHLFSQPIHATDGLSSEIPGDCQPCNLSRGPTPRGSSITTTRQPIEIASATAGSNSDGAADSFDDNEITGWSNDGRLSTAWIAYQFTYPALVSELTMKLAGWRTRGYPIRITLDGREVYRGVTPRSLGYVTIPIEPTRGQSLKIELQGTASERDEFNLVEVTGEKDAAGTIATTRPGTTTASSRPSEPRGMLNIIELEIYGPK